MKDKAEAAGKDYNASVPIRWLGFIAPEAIGGGAPDFGQGSNGFDRNWQCFWGLLLSSIMLVVTFISVKKEST